MALKKAFIILGVLFFFKGIVNLNVLNVDCCLIVECFNYGNMRGLCIHASEHLDLSRALSCWVVLKFVGYSFAALVCGPCLSSAQFS